MSVTGAITSTDADWHAFSKLPKLVNHWDRKGWWPGRTGYYWYLTFEHAEGLHSLARVCQNAIRHDSSFDIVPPHDLHMTLDRVGFEDEVAENAVSKVEKHAHGSTERFTPFTIDVGPLAGSSGALSFSATPYSRINDLRISLVRTPNTAIDASASESYFRPHVGIAYCNTSIPAGPVIDTVRSLRSLPPVSVLVTQVSLVSLTRLPNSYRWTVRRTFPLGGYRSGATEGALSVR